MFLNQFLIRYFLILVLSHIGHSKQGLMGREIEKDLLMYVNAVVGYPTLQ